MSTYDVGLDVHKPSISIAFLNATGKLVMESVIETSAATILDSLKVPTLGVARVAQLMLHRSDNVLTSGLTRRVGATAPSWWTWRSIASSTSCPTERPRP